jgi:hypothetical protein
MAWNVEDERPVEDRNWTGDPTNPNPATSRRVVLLEPVLSRPLERSHRHLHDDTLSDEALASGSARMRGAASYRGGVAALELPAVGGRGRV